MLQKFSAVLDEGAGGEIPAEAFCEASLSLISVFDLITGMGMPASDMKGNATTIQKIAKATPGSTLEKLVSAETGGKSQAELKKIVGDGTKASCALLWLVRALSFIVKMLDELMVQPEKSMSACVLAGYDVSLKPHHGFMIRGTFQVAVKAAPNRETFIAKLGEKEEVFKQLKEATPKLTGLVIRLQEYLESIDSTHFHR